MAELETHENYIESRKDNNGDYVHQSLWTHSDTVETPDGDVLTNKVNAGVFRSDALTPVETPVVPVSIDDSVVSTESTWSSSKVNTQINTKATINDAVTTQSTTWSGSKINSAIAASNHAFTTGILAGNSSEWPGKSGVIFAARAGASGSPDMVVVDQWGGVSYSSGTVSLIEISTSSTSAGEHYIQIVNTANTAITVCGLLFD